MILPWFPRSLFGTVLAGIYMLVSAVIVYQERTSVGVGNWISLRGIASYIVTLPVSLPFEYYGHRLDYRRNLDMSFAIGVCAAGIYFFGAGLIALALLI